MGPFKFNPKIKYQEYFTKTSFNISNETLNKANTF